MGVSHSLLPDGARGLTGARARGAGPWQCPSRSTQGGGDGSAPSLRPAPAWALCLAGCPSARVTAAAMMFVGAVIATATFALASINKTRPTLLDSCSAYGRYCVRREASSLRLMSCNHAVDDRVVYTAHHDGQGGGGDGWACGVSELARLGTRFDRPTRKIKSDDLDRGLPSYAKGVAIYVRPQPAATATATPDGSANRPFASLHQARDAMRTGLGRGRPRTVLVEGTHYMNTPFHLDSRDTASAESPVTWRSRFPHAPARLSGGLRLPIDAFQPASVPSGAAGVLKMNLFEHGFNESMVSPLKAELNQGSRFLVGAPELFVDGEAMLRARSPNVAQNNSWVFAGYQNMSGPTANASWAQHSNTSFIFTDAYLAPLWQRAAHNGALWLHGYFQWDWRDTYVQVGSITNSSRNAWEVTRAPDSPPGPDSQFTKGSRFYALGALELLDSPGEYHINSSTGELWLLPLRPLLSNTELVVSVLDTVVDVEEVSYHNFENLQITDGRKSLLVLQGTHTLGNNQVHNCTIINAGGVCLSAAGNNNSIRKNKIGGCGMGGIEIFAGMPTSALVAGNTSLIGNQISNVSRIARTCTSFSSLHLFLVPFCILVAQRSQLCGCYVDTPTISVAGDGNYIGHNYLAHTPHTAYMQGGCDNLFEHNIMEHVCFETADASGFYVGRSWVQRGNIVRRNTFRHIRATTQLGLIAAGAPCCQQTAFYLDDEISGFDFCAYISLLPCCGRAVSCRPLPTAERIPQSRRHDTLKTLQFCRWEHRRERWSRRSVGWWSTQPHPLQQLHGLRL
eukprot:COSAG02_NODE_1523_length_12140_cov_16.419650_7_plen_794_part_00